VRKNRKTESEKAQAGNTIRASISFPPQVYETLEIIAKEKKVSLAWVVREAAERYIGDRWPLFERKTGEQG
jgi:metal-responsive CopG/Arc/MetJ family transcriptional regulator